MADFETIFREWDDNKDTLFEMLGRNLIVRRPYTYVISDDTLTQKIQDKRYDTPCYKFMNWWYREIVAPLTNQKNVNTELRKLCELVVESKTLAENKYPGKTKTIYLPPDNESYKVSQGMRPMKIITKIAQKYNCDEKLLEDFRLWHSQILNNKHMDGELCLSIHPMDYMTMSDNDNNWQSCMNWMNNGDYRLGTVECMNSPYVLVAYLHNPNHSMSIGPYEWNSKHWRELFIIHPEMISEVKGYCFQDENLTNTILMWIKELAHNNLDWDYDNDEINVNDTNPIPFKDGDLSFHIQPECYMYNDFGTLDKHRARINREKIGNYKLTEWQTPRDSKWHYMLELSYGGNATCMWCGKSIAEYDKENFVFCERCEKGLVCACCGDYIRNGDERYDIEDFDGPICQDCMEYECGLDDITEETHLNNNLSYVRWLIGYNENDKPIFWDFGINVYEPQDNEEYKQIFHEPPHFLKDGYRLIDYITLDDVKDYDAFEDLFNLDDTVDNIMMEYLND